MVVMNFTQTDQYPQLTDWLRNTLPAVRDKDQVWRALLEFSGLEEGEAARALSWESDPIIGIKRLQGRNGEFDPRKPDRVYLAKDIALRFERDFTLSEAQLLVEATVLHEIVHWGNHKDGPDQADEAGVRFEVTAYGKDIERYWMQSTRPLRAKTASITQVAKDNGCCIPPFTPKPSDPRGIRNNNPGNIRIGSPWKGLAKPDQRRKFQRNEKDFCVFIAPEWGIRAMARLLANYQNRHKLHTVSAMINRWAPPSENDTSNYVGFIAEEMNVLPNEGFAIRDYGRAYPMVHAIIKMENGQQPYSKRLIDRGLLLADIATV